jgi:hypothetical protein
MQQGAPLALLVCFLVSIVHCSMVDQLYGLATDSDEKLLDAGDLNWSIMTMLWESDYGSKFIDIQRCKNPPDSLCTFAKAEIKVKYFHSIEKKPQSRNQIRL